MPTSVRLDPDTEALLKRLARQSNRSKSEVIRDALHRMTDYSSELNERSSPYPSIADLLGVAAGGSATLARNHKRVYRDGLTKKHRR